MPPTDKLLDLLRRHAILHTAPEQPIRTLDGQNAPWMFYSWAVSLDPHGLPLLTRALLERLGTFEARYLASYGFTSLPMVAACVAASKGRWRGLGVRKERKTHGSMRRIEGSVEPGSSVVVLDDSLVSGNSALQAIAALEEEGLRVEGVLCVVDFSARGGRERLTALGYRVETLYDVWRDLQAPVPEFVPPFRSLTPARWGPALADGLHPAVAARRVAEVLLAGGEPPAPAARFDADYDARGGTFVSFRQRADEARVARDGYWHFDAADADAGRDLVLAVVKIIQDHPALPLNDLKIAVTFFGPLELTAPSALDYARRGIVVRSRIAPTRMGGALPNTQVFTNEIEQYYHARVRNAKIGEFEPHDVYTHTLTKCVEPGAYWLPYGFPRADREWSERDDIGRRLTERARDHLLALIGNGVVRGEPVPDELVPAPVSAVSVTLFHRGILGCGLTHSATLEQCLERATQVAWTDARYAKARQGVAVNDAAVSVSLLHDREWLGEGPPSLLANKVRVGLDSVAALVGGKRGILLPFVATYFNRTRQHLPGDVLRKAGSTTPPFAWGTFQTTSWLLRGKRLYKLTYGLPDRSATPVEPAQWRDDTALLARFIMAHLGGDGLPAYLYDPVAGRSRASGTAPRVVHALSALLEAGAVLDDKAMLSAATKGLRHCLDHVQTGEPMLILPGHEASSMGDAILLAAVAEHAELRRHPAAALLAETLQSWLRPDGRIAPQATGRGVQSDHDFLPGAVLLALARWWHHSRGEYIAFGDQPPPATPSLSWSTNLNMPPDLSAQLQWYRRRFDITRGWGLVGWQTQAWAALPAGRDFVHELADHLATWQHDGSGAYLARFETGGLSFHTGWLCEAMAEAWRTAQGRDAERAARYERSTRRALDFMGRLIIRPEDTFCMADPARAIGGVRGTVNSSEVRIDFVSHTLAALVRAVRCLQPALRNC